MTRFALAPLAAAFALAAAAPAHAGHVASASAAARVYTLPTFVDLGPWPVQVNDGTGFTTGAPNTTATAVNAGGTVSGKTVDAAARADLATRSLGVRTHAANALGTAEVAGVATASATFGDSFRLQDAQGGAFQWTPGERAGFSVALDGQSVNQTSRTQLDWSVWINLYAPGTLDGPSSTWYDHLLGTGQWTSNRYADGSVRIFTDLDSTRPDTGLQLAWSGDLNAGTLALQASFETGGDFDWTLTLYSSTSPLTTQVGSMTADLMHTAHVSFAAPGTAEVLSSSGAFDTVSPVPEPGTWALFGAGLGALALRRRRRSLAILCAAAAPALCAAETFADSVADFSGVQGQGGWYYGYYEGVFHPSAFRLLPNWSETAGTWTLDAEAPAPTYWTVLSAEAGHPNGLVTSGGREQVEQWAVRRWVSDVSGAAVLRGEVADLNGGGGNGVVARVFVDGVQWLGVWIPNAYPAPYTFELPLQLAAGTTLDFAIDPYQADDLFDLTRYTVTITSAVPEPASAALLACGGAWLAWRRRQPRSSCRAS